MSIFDKFKDKATELLQGAGDKVSEATGIDLSGVTDKVTETAQGLGETAQGVGETAAQDLGETAQGYADTAGDQVTEATGVDLPTEGLTDQATDKLGDITGR